MRIPRQAFAVTLAAGAALGAVGGIATAQHAINQVPVEREKVEVQVPVTQNDRIGEISYNFRQPGEIAPYHDSAKTVPVFRNQPVMRDGRVWGESSSTRVEYRTHTETREGHGKPRTSFQTREVIGHRFQGQNRHVRQETETRQVGTEMRSFNEVVGTRSETYTIPGRCYSVSSADGGSSQACEPSSTGTRQVSVYGMVSRPVPVMRNFVIGHQVNYTPRIQTVVVDSYQHPVTTFDHGINVGGYLAKGALAGIGAGALAAGGVMMAEKSTGKKENESAGYSQLNQDPSKHKEAIDPEWTVVTPTSVGSTDDYLDKTLGPFHWHVHEDPETGEKAWDYHRVPEGKWHQHRANAEVGFQFADKSVQSVVADEYIVFKTGEEPSGYHDPQFHDHLIKNPQSGEALIAIEVGDKPNVMQRKGGPHEMPPNLPGIEMRPDSVTRT